MDKKRPNKEHIIFVPDNVNEYHVPYFQESIATFNNKPSIFPDFVRFSVERDPITGLFPPLTLPNGEIVQVKSIDVIQDKI